MNGRFAILEFLQYIQPWGYYLCFRTDTPCHLWLWYRHRKPAKDLEPVLKRGIQVHCKPKWSFKTTYQLEQQEAGDTLWHGFRYEPSYMPKYLWFYLMGTINGADVPSTSPIFNLPWRIGYVNDMKYQLTDVAMCRYVRWNLPRAMNFKGDIVFDLGGLEIELFDTKNNLKSTLALHNASPVDGKPTSLIVSTTIDLLPPKFPLNARRWLYFPLESIELNWNQMYAIVLTGDPDYPDSNSLCWYVKFRPGLDEDEYAWNGVRVGGSIVWTRDENFVRTYKSWAGVANFQPGPPTPAQIYPSE